MTSKRNQSGVLVLSLIVVCFGSVFVGAFEGGLVDSDLTLDIFNSPYNIIRNVWVDQDAVLTIDAGVEMRFSPGVMVAVNGTLIAKVGKVNRGAES